MKHTTTATPRAGDPRLARVGGATAALALLGVGAFAFLPLSTRGLEPCPNPARDYDEAAARFAHVVLGDVVKVTAGDQIIVDGQVIGTGRIEADESLVTGESDLIPRQAGDPVFSGSYCVSGSAYYVAERIGADSLVNQITAGARSFRRVLTPLQEQINTLVRVFLLIVIYMEVLILFNSLLAARDMTESVQEATVIAGLIPNGLFLSIAVTYAISAVRILNFGVMVQQSNAIESLSNVDTLCVDKTGTLTANRLQMHAVHPIGISQAELETILGEMVASSTAPNKTSAAIAAAYARPERPLLAEVPFSSARKWSAVAFDTPERRGIYALGAPEMLQPYVTPTSGDQMAGVTQTWADQGLRVLLVAMRSSQKRIAMLSGFINLRNLLQVSVSADTRYGPIYNYGTASVIVQSLREHGYRPDSGTPITLFGYSGGGQIVLGSARYLKATLQAPVQIISLGGVMNADPGIEVVERLYHLYGTRDSIQRVGGIVFPKRWPVFAHSPWNRAMAEQRVRFINMGPIGHNGPGGYIDADSYLDDGRSFLDHTVDTTCRLVQEMMDAHRV